MSEPKLSKQQIYDKISETSKDEYILSEMKRLGFWPEDTEKPSLTEEFINKRAELQDKLRELGKKQRLYDDPDAALRQLHKERKAEALKNREQTRRERNRDRYDRATKWHNTQQKLITYVGDSFSKGLADVTSNVERLESQSIPVLRTSQDLAEVMGISVNELRYLVYFKDVTKTCHYQRFLIAKKSGGTREISAPMPRLKRAQYWVLDNILEPLKLHDAAHGFVPDRSITTNAKHHVGKDIVINLDLKDFFPTIDYKRVKGLFKHLGYSEHLATILGLLCTEPETQQIELDNKRLWVSSTQRKLPQGAPTSPNISNLICRKMDARLKGMADSLGFNYTRYADDITFSARHKTEQEVRQVLWRCRQIIRSEGFIVHPDKTRVMRNHKRQEVTGITVNEKLSVNRKDLKRFRALLFQIDKDGPEGKTWGKGNLFPSISGYANFVAMVDQDKGAILKQQVNELKKKYMIQTEYADLTPLNNKTMRKLSAAGKSPKESWWQAKARPEPVLEKTPNEIAEEKKQLKEREKAVEKLENEGVSDNSNEDDVEAGLSTGWGPRMYRILWIWLLIFIVLRILAK